MERPVARPGTAERRLRQLSARLVRDAALLAGTAANSAKLRAARNALFVEEIASSMALAGYVLTRRELSALLTRGVALGGRALLTYESVADYADAATFVADQEATRGRRGHAHLKNEDLLELHRRACRRTSDAAGSWRERNLPAVRSGLVPPPHWLVPREIAAFTDRFAGGPPVRIPPLVWVAGAHARFLRIQPFDQGNGRVARLVANLLLRRIGWPSAAFAKPLAARYAAAIAAADGGKIEPLAQLTGEAVAGAFVRLLAVATGDDELRPLRELVPARRLDALVKAAQRGRLRVVRRAGRVLSTTTWIGEYQTTRDDPAAEVLS